MEPIREMAKRTSIEIIDVKNYVDRHGGKLFIPVDSFMVRDIVSLMKHFCPLGTIIFVNGYSASSQEDKRDILMRTIELFKNQKNCLIISHAYVSKLEFPESEYYDDNENLSEEDKKGKEPVPYDKILKRESELLESLNFSDFNWYCNLNYSIPFIYNNELGIKFLKFVKDFTDRREE